MHELQISPLKKRPLRIWSYPITCGSMRKQKTVVPLPHPQFGSITPIFGIDEPHNIEGPITFKANGSPNSAIKLIVRT